MASVQTALYKFAARRCQQGRERQKVSWARLCDEVISGNLCTPLIPSSGMNRHAITPGFAVLYQWHVKPGKVKQFVTAWGI